MNLFAKSFAAIALCASAFCAHASVITFSGGSPATTFADGSFRVEKDPTYGYDNGFFPVGGGDSTLAGFGLGAPATIYFNKPVLFQSLTLVPGGESLPPDSVTISLYDSSNQLIGGTTVDLPGFFRFEDTEIFNVANVSSVDFKLSYSGERGDSVQLFLDNITYSLDGAGNDVPEPASLALLGLGACAFAARRRKRA